MQKNLVLLIIFIVILPVSGSPLSFDILFPMTWYEKSVNSMIFVFNSLSDKSYDDFSQNDFDVFLGKCIFAHFCLERMAQSKQMAVEEDISHFIVLLDALEKKLSLSAVDHDYHDYVLCLGSIITAMKSTLQVPTNINPK